MAVSCMHNASGNNYRNSTFIVDEAMGQIHVPQHAFLVKLKDSVQFIHRLFIVPAAEY